MEFIVLLILVCIFFIVREMNTDRSLKTKEVLESENRIMERILAGMLKSGPSDGEGSGAVSPTAGQQTVSSNSLVVSTNEREEAEQTADEDHPDGMLATVFTSGAVDISKGRAAWCAYVRSKGAMSEPGGILKGKVANALHAEVAAAAEGIKHAIEQLGLTSGDTILLQSSSEYALQVLSGSVSVAPDAPEAGIVFHIVDLLRTQHIGLRIRHRTDGNGDRQRRDRALQLVETRVQELLLKGKKPKGRKGPDQVVPWDSRGSYGQPEERIDHADRDDDPFVAGPEAAPLEAGRRQPPQSLAGLVPPPLPAGAYPSLAAANSGKAGGVKARRRA
jgi:hypothetical protein